MESTDPDAKHRNGKHKECTTAKRAEKHPENPERPEFATRDTAFPSDEVIRDNSPDNHAAFVDVVGPVGFGRGGHDVDGHGACGLSARHITSKRLRLRLSSCLLRLGFVDGLGLLDDVATLGAHLLVALKGVAAVVTHFCHGEIRGKSGRRRSGNGS